MESLEELSVESTIGQRATRSLEDRGDVEVETGESK